MGPLQLLAGALFCWLVGIAVGVVVCVCGHCVVVVVVVGRVEFCVVGVVVCECLVPVAQVVEDVPVVTGGVVAACWVALPVCW